MESNRRPESMERITTPALAEAFIEEQLRAIREQVGGGKVHVILFRRGRRHAPVPVPSDFRRRSVPGDAVAQKDDLHSLQIPFPFITVYFRFHLHYIFSLSCCQIPFLISAADPLSDG